MLLFAPIILLLLAALLIVIIYNSKRNYAACFMTASIGTFAAWLIALILRFYLPSKVLLPGWGQDFIFFDTPFLSLDYTTWSFALALITICMAGVFTDSARVSTESNPISWAGMMLITAFGMIALLAGNPLMMILAWVFMDILELVYMIITQADVRLNQNNLTILGIHLLSIAMFFVATIIGRRQAGSAFDLTNLPTSSSIFYLLAAGLRLGVLPLTKPYYNDPQINRGMRTLLHLAPAASSLSLIARLPGDALDPQLLWVMILTALIAISAIYAGIKFASQPDAITGRPYWIIALSSLGSYCAINGFPDASRAWSLSLLLPGALLFLFKPQLVKMRFLLYFGLLGLSALPYTPAASGWDGIIGNRFSFWTPILIIAHTALTFGYLRFIWESNDESAGLETWAKIIFPIGLIIIIQTNLIVGLAGWPGSITAGDWWPGLVSLLLFAGLIILRKYQNLNKRIISFFYEKIRLEEIKALGNIADKVFRLEWISAPFLWIINFFGHIALGITTVLEGEGGILWAVVILVILITIFISSGGAS